MTTHPTPLSTHPPTPIPGEQVCGLCGYGYPPLSYHPKKRGVRGSYCRACCREYKQRYRIAREGTHNHSDKPRRTAPQREEVSAHESMVIVDDEPEIPQKKISESPRPKPLTVW